MKIFISTVTKRFLKGFISGAFAAGITVQLQAPERWATLFDSLNTLLLVMAIGGISGGLLACDKAMQFLDKEPTK